MRLLENRRQWAYLLVVALFGAALWRILSVGERLETSAGRAAAVAAFRGEARSPAGQNPAAPHLAQDASGRRFPRPFKSPLGLLLLQAFVIIAFTRACAGTIRRFGQPGVIGEMLGGILLGPSVLGLLWPAGGAVLFPPDSLAPLHSLSQLGLIVFMFIVGMGLNTAALKKEAPTAVMISHASIILPFLLGSLLSLVLYAGYAPEHVPFSSFCLFMGIAMSVTAFPVLARIIHEKGMSHSPLGTMALTCAAVDDVTAWCALAVVVGIARSETVLRSAGTALACGLYIAAMLFLVRPVFRRWMERRLATRPADKRTTAIALLAALLSAFLTETLGIHALFGAFLAGVVMPKNMEFRRDVSARLEDFCAIVLLPLFFALTGLRTQVGLLNDARGWGVCGLIVLVAIAGKLGGGALTARWSGMTPRESLAIGALMNTRGLVELVVLNIGYDLGIITPAIFTMMVLMALVTTLMTGPLLDVLLPNLPRSASETTPLGDGGPA